MPQFRVAKTKNINTLKNKSSVEDKLYILKVNDTVGKIYYDYDNDTRLEFEPSTDIYYCKLNLTDSVATIDIKNIKSIRIDESGVTYENINLDKLQSNLFILTDDSIYNIRTVDLTKNQVIAIKVYSPQPLVWNDYYNE